MPKAVNDKNNWRTIMELINLIFRKITFSLLKHSLTEWKIKFLKENLESEFPYHECEINL